MDIVCYIKEPSHVLKLHNFLIRKWGKVLEGVKMGVKGPYLVEPTLFTKKSCSYGGDTEIKKVGMVKDLK